MIERIHINNINNKRDEDSNPNRVEINDQSTEG